MKTQIQSTVAPANLARALVRVCLRAALGLLAAIATVSPPVRAAVTEAWVHRYNNVVNDSVDQAVKVVRDATGDIIVTGTTREGISRAVMLTIKYSGADGTVLWQKRYSGARENGSVPSAVAVDGSGNVVVAGGSTVKYASADGALLWEQRSTTGGQALAIDGSGNVLVTGYSESGYYHTAKYAATDGALLWEKPYGEDQAVAVAVDDSGNVVVTGSSYANRGVRGVHARDHQNKRDCYTAKYAEADGALLWEKRYNGPANDDDRAQALAVDGSGNVVVTGYSRNGAPNNDSDFYTAKYASADGRLLWEQRYNGSANSNDFADAVTLDGSGNVLVAGYSATVKYAAADGALLWKNNGGSILAVDSTGNVVVTGGSYYTAKYAAADGALLWEQFYTGPADGYSFATAVAVDGSGNVVVTGTSSNGASNYDTDYYTAKYAETDGALLWEKRYNGPVNREDRANAVAVDASGNVVVTGSSAGAYGFDSEWFGRYPVYDYYTAKYAAADGALLWEKRYHDSWFRSEIANVVAVDNSGNVVVTGASYTLNWGYVYYTAKYAAEDGALLWEKYYQTSGGGNGSANGVAVDGGGNVLVTGTTSNGAGNSDQYTAKYAAADGTLLWEKHFNSLGNGNDSAKVAVDGSGNMVISGYSASSIDAFGNPDYKYYTAMFAAADGALLWEKRGPGGGAAAVALDESGNVLVTGTSSNSDHTTDFYTAKYAAADGALIWEKRLNGPANSYDYATAVALDGTGNAVVSGYSTAGFDALGNPHYNYYTAMYASADGALLWEKPGPGGRAAGVAMDGSGNVVVSGNSWNGTNDDYYTAKYAAADGALLWEKRYNGPANGADSVGPPAHFENASHSLALGPGGMVAVTGTSFGASGTSDYATVVYRDTPPVSFADWATCSGLTGANAAADADPDSDGLPNGVEYILGGNSTVPGTSASPTATASAGGNVILTFPRDDSSETPDVTLSVETGTNLLTWPAVFHIGPDTAASSPGVSITENGAAPDTVTVTIPQGKPTRLFARLKVRITP